MMRWAIDLDPDSKARLPRDVFDLGDLVYRDDGGERLLFRDRFVALKVASRLGGNRPVALSDPSDG
jgi:hypothetical protein